MKRFWATIKAGLKTRMLIRISTLISCYFVAYAPTVPLVVVALCLAVFLGGIMLTLEVGAFTEPIKWRWKLRGKIRWEDPPPFVQDLASHMKIKLNKKKPFGIINEPIGAAANILGSQIIIGSDVLALPENQRNAVLAHELGHLRPNQMFWLYCLVYGVVLIAPTLGDVHPLVTIIGGASLFFILRTLISWKMEYSADSFSATHTSGEDLASALQRLSNLADQNTASDTHPSINSRIEKVLRTYEKEWIFLVYPLVGKLTGDLFRREFLGCFLSDLDDQYKRYPVVIKQLCVCFEIIKVILMCQKYKD